MQPAAPRRVLRRLVAWLALVTVAALLWSPLAPASAEAHGAPMAGCHMASETHAAASKPPVTRHGDLCAAACALCGQLWAAPAVSVPAPGREASRVSYARGDTGGDGIAPARATPPPR